MGPMFLLPLFVIWLRDPMYFNASSRWAVVVLAVATVLTAPSSPSGGDAVPGSAKVRAAEPAPEFTSSAGASSAVKSAADDPLRFREGSRLEPTIGRFIQQDRGWIFEIETTGLEVAAPGESQATEGRDDVVRVYRFHVLENLSLQRVAMTMQQDMEDSRWSVSGILTEYFGENRLLLTAAVRAPRTKESP